MIALFTALIAPYFIDWTAYKRDFEVQASKIFGQEVRVDGRATVRILPLPSVQFEKISVGQNPNGSALMTAKQFSTRVELMPFLSGEVRIVDMKLSEPVFNVFIDEDGQITWTNRNALLLNPDQVKLEKLNISNAVVNISGLFEDSIIQASKINANVSAKSLHGPWFVDARGDVDGVDTQFKIVTGRLQKSGAIRLKIDTERSDLPYRLNLDGPITLVDDLLEWQGKFELEPVTGSTALPVRTEGNFKLTPHKAIVPEYRLNIGPKNDPFTLSGTGEANLKGKIDFSLEVDGRQIDMDRMAEIRGQNKNNQNSLESRIELVRDIVNQIPIPNISGEIDLEIPAIVAGDTLIRGVSALIRPRDRGWEIVRLTSSFPGNTKLEANGRLGIMEEFGFHGKLLVASRQPSGFAAWATDKVDPAIRRLASAGLEAEVTLTKNQTSFDELVLILDGKRLRGSAKRIAPLSADEDNSSLRAPAIIANISGELLQFEELRAVLALISGDKKALGHDFDITLGGRQLTAFGMNAKEVDLQLQYKGGALSITRLNAGNFLGASISSKGQISNLLDKPSGNIALNIESKDASELIGLIQEKLDNEHELDFLLNALASDNAFVANANLAFELDANATEIGSKGRVIVNGSFGGSELSLLSSFDGNLKDLNNLHMDTSIRLSNEKPEVLLGQIGAGEIGFNPYDSYSLNTSLAGPLNVNFDSVGTGAKGYSTLISFNTPDTSLSADGIIRPSVTTTPKFDFDITSGSKDIAPYLTAFGYPLPGLKSITGEAIPFSLSGEIKRENEKLNLKIRKAQLSGNLISGALSQQKSLSGRPKIEGILSLKRFSLLDFSQLVYGSQSNEFDELIGELTWSENEFTAPALSHFDSKLSIHSEFIDMGISVAGSQSDSSNLTAKNASFDLEISNGDGVINNMIMDIFGGRVKGNAAFKNSDGTGLFQSQFSSENLNSSLMLEAAGAGKFLTGNLQINGTIDGSGNSAMALLNSLSGSGIIEVSEGEFQGINGEGLNELLEQTDVEEFEINAKKVEPVIEKAFLSGNLAFGNQTAAYSVNRGKVQLRNLALKGEKWKADINTDISLVDGQVDSSIRMFVNAGKHKVSGASPEIRYQWTGPMNDIKRETDSQAMLGFLSIRAFEAEQRRVEILQANILEKQRLRHELFKSERRTMWLEAKRLAEIERLEKEEAERRAKQAEIKAQAEAKLKKQQLIATQKAAIKKAQEEAKAEENKTGFVIRELEQPNIDELPSIFDNIDELLLPQAN